MTQKRYTEIPKRQKCVNKEEPYIGGAEDIVDDTLGKPQSEVNQDRVEDIAAEVKRAQGAESTLDGKIGAEKTRAEVVEGGLNTRLQTVEQLAEISIGGGDIGIGTAADFESDDPSDLAKVPTIGAILGGTNDGVYDISARHNGTKYADLEAALGTDGANVPVGVRKGGMSIKFVQSSDNKYVQYRLTKDTWSTTVSDWQGIDKTPIAGSKNLVDSNGVAEVTDNINVRLTQFDGNLNNIGWSNTRLANGNQSSRIYDNKRVSCNEAIYVGKGNRIKVTPSVGIEVQIHFYIKKDTDQRSSFSPFISEDAVYTANEDYAIFTLKKVSGGTDQVISPDEAKNQVSLIVLSLEDIRQSILLHKTISIVGDSISTYDGYSDGNYTAFYPKGNVDSIEKTWWYNFITKVHGNLGENLSVVGARVSNGDESKPSLVSQVSSLSSCDVVILAGGQNDYQNNVSIGTLDFSKETSVMDDSKFGDAYIHYVRNALEKASGMVVCVITHNLTQKYASVIKEVADYYNCVCVDLRAKLIDMIVTSHPNQQGMRMMSDCVLNAILAYSVSDKEHKESIEKTLYDVENRILQYQKTDPDNSKFLDLGELGNYTSVDGTNTLTPNSKRVSTMVPVYVGKGNFVTVIGKSDWKVNANLYNTTETGANRISYTDVIPLTNPVKISAVADYILLTFRKTDDSIISPKEISGYGSGFNVYVTNYVNRTDYYSDKGYGQYSLLELTDKQFMIGSINNNNGEIFFNANSRVSEFIPVQPGSKFQLYTPTVDGVKIHTTVSFYNVKEDGTYQWNSDFKFDSNNTFSYVFTNKTFTTVNVIVPPTANAFRFYVTTNSSTLPSLAQIYTLVNISCHTRSQFKNVDYKAIETKGCVIKFNSEGIEWEQGFGFSNFNSSIACIASPYFAVYQGQRIRIMHDNQNKVYNTAVYEYSELCSERLSPTRNLNFGTIYTPSDNVEYIRIAASSGTDGAESVTPEICVADNWHLIDVSSKPMSLQRAELVLEKECQGTYAQGMAICNGILFQAFASGNIELYDINTLEFIQSIAVPVSSDTESSTMHCNNITFGIDKYNSADEFPVLWINNEGSRTKFIGLRVQRSNDVYSFTKVYEVQPPAIPENYQADDQYFDFKNKVMVQVAYLQVDGVTNPSSSGYCDITLWVYRWTGDLQDGNFTLVHSFDFPILWAMQGGRIIDGILYLVSGPTMNEINVFNVLSKELVGIIDITKGNFNITKEAQGFDWYGVPYITSTNASEAKWWLHKLYL